jgi:hypothetical protein
MDYNIGDIIILRHNKEWAIFKIIEKDLIPYRFDGDSPCYEGKLLKKSEKGSYIFDDYYYPPYFFSKESRWNKWSKKVENMEQVLAMIL